MSYKDIDSTNLHFTAKPKCPQPWEALDCSYGIAPSGVLVSGGRGGGTYHSTAWLRIQAEEAKENAAKEAKIAEKLAIYKAQEEEIEREKALKEEQRRAALFEIAKNTGAAKKEQKKKKEKKEKKGKKAKKGGKAKKSDMKKTTKRKKKGSSSSDSTSSSSSSSSPKKQRKNRKAEVEGDLIGELFSSWRAGESNAKDYVDLDALQANQSQVDIDSEDQAWDPKSNVNSDDL